MLDEALGDPGRSYRLYSINPPRLEPAVDPQSSC
jgi:hypothetical protein